MTSRDLRRVLVGVVAALLVPLLVIPASTAQPSARQADADRYHNPLKPRVPGDGTVDSCADPAVIRGQEKGDKWWYMYCTTDPLNDGDTAGDGENTFHPIPMMRSRDLVNWTYRGDAIPEPPSYAAEGAGIWAPDVVYSKAFDRYYLTFVVTNTEPPVGTPGCNGDSAIGVATSKNPMGPWKVSDTPVVPPRKDPNSTDPCAFFWTYDPDVLGNSIGANGILYYGSYYGGVYGTKVSLTRRSMHMTGAPTPIAIPNRYEGTNVIKRAGRYYMFASATNCCNGSLTGYSVYAGRSQSPLGPFRDRDGNTFLESRVGGTPVISMNGNRWVGTGHNSVFRDFDGQWWTIYHAADRFDPYFEDEPGFTKRPALLDPLDWKNGWPTVRANRWASDKRMPAPAAQPGERTAYEPNWLPNHQPGAKRERFSDEFNDGRLGDRWSWVRKPAESEYGEENGAFRFDTQNKDLTEDSNSASVLVRNAPERNYVVQTKVHFNVPPDYSEHNYVQAGVALYGGDDRFLKLVHVSIWETRQTEFAKEIPSGFDGTSAYGNTVVGPPADWTYLRIVKQNRPGQDEFTAYTRQPGERWVRGGTWRHDLGDNARIGLVSMGGQEGTQEFRARFDYVRVFGLR
ncbi:MAG: GH43_3 / GH43 / GH43_5 / GH43_4 / GH43_ 30 / GH43_31 / GH43_33 / GH43_6 / GH43_34 / GH4 3_8 / GH43_13 / GH43_32 / GH43_7 [uncultured Nocardioidaceae bacterium]|uniref:GH43_3 / GH43 / GH43_5 / GH43_4 / GH43_ 30 / GH43_31 / GH43_33 / GH43_6 / GH43_34 / GH4 3_8 / GH43_13 / GH43_32 / GH43_7 n=1 Tax=uncultured Nocardioidaceae bacterium TaxID=253824 RepID=A0A6J4M7E1_9ACTN|nr:MAG: GH43_3 / GH43 / GH43_5 / GH43_4 / GH43_ 30 / GH43_31 / GH43_33 / GH43_6 / GH43_34 / GH4 3_8 / GH43_13 / GH43_32 / GH43_7 [uncultured Nocardioidaceae bacterium]